MVADDEDGDRTGFGGRRYGSRLLQTLSYDDEFADYLAFLEPRLTRARELLAPHGTLYFHIDYREAHYCKLLLDEVFGREAFLNELIWAYDYGAKPRRRWPAKHDTILVYVRTPGAPLVRRRRRRARAVHGAGSGRRREGRARQAPDRRLVPHDRARPTGARRPATRRRSPRACCAGSWRPPRARAAGAWTPFAGSGTLGAVCRQLGRRFVLIDENPVAVEVMRARLGGAALDGEPRGLNPGAAELAANPPPRTSGTNRTGSSRVRSRSRRPSESVSTRR